jgi:hypothetical protein
MRFISILFFELQGGRERRLEIVGDRGWECRAKTIGFRSAPRALQILDQVDALNGERTLVDQRVEQPALVGG